MATFDVNGILVSPGLTLFGFKANDFVGLDGRRAQVIGVSENNELCCDAGNTVEFRAAPAGLILLARSGVDYAAGHIVQGAADTAYAGEKGTVLALDPSTEMVLVEFEKFQKPAEDRTWLAGEFINQSNRAWINPALHRLIKVTLFKPLCEAAIGEKLQFPETPAELELKQMPDWLRELDHYAKAKTSHCFLLSGNVHDWQRRMNSRYQQLASFLTEVFKERELVMYYAISTGLRFANDEMEKRFKDWYLKPVFLGQPPKEKPKGDSLAASLTDIKQVQKKQFELASVTQIIEGMSPDKVFPWVERAMLGAGREKEQTNGAVLIMEFPAHIFPKEDQGNAANFGQRVITETMQRWAVDGRMRGRKNIIIMIAPDFLKVDAELRASVGVKQIQLKAPEEKTRAERWNYWLSAGGLAIESGVEADKLARVSTGFSLRDIDELCRLTRVRRERLAYAQIKARKQTIFKERFGARINVVDPPFGFEYFGGREEAKAYLRKIGHYMETGLFRRVPMGILAPGPPGTGKSLFFQCCAHEFGFNFVEFQNTRSKWLGESEEILDFVLSTFEELMPLFVYEDEADQSEGARDAPDCDSGVSNRMRQKKFIFCADPKHRGKIVWVRVSNRDDLLDAAYKRKGRSDQVIPFVFQSAEEMADIFRVMFKRYEVPTTVTDFRPYVAEAQKKIYFVGSDVEWAVLEADFLSGEEERKAVTEKDLIEAIDSWEFKGSPVQFDRQVVSALENSSRRLRPKGWEVMLKQANERLAKSGARWSDGHIPDPNIPLGGGDGVAGSSLNRALRERRRAI